jgi:hypothetical protein
MMSVSTILEIVIGLFLIYYILGLFVSAITSWFTKGLEIRANDLEKYLTELFKDKESLDNVLKHPLINALKPIRLTPIVGFFTGGTTEYKAEKIPPATFIQALFGQTIEVGKNIDDVKKAIKDVTNTLPEDSQLRKDINRLVEDAGSDLTKLRETIASWFDGAMQKASEIYTAHARRIVIALALVITLITGADSIDIAKQLWDQPNLRAVASAKAIEVAEGSELEPDIQVLVTTLDDLELEYHNDWWNTRNTADNPNAILLKILGLAITWGAVSQGSSFWYDVMKKVSSFTRIATPSSKPEQEETPEKS